MSNKHFSDMAISTKETMQIYRDLRKTMVSLALFPFSFGQSTSTSQQSMFTWHLSGIKYYTMVSKREDKHLIDLSCISPCCSAIYCSNNRAQAGYESWAWTAQIRTMTCVPSNGICRSSLGVTWCRTIRDVMQHANFALRLFFGILWRNSMS